MIPVLSAFPVDRAGIPETLETLGAVCRQWSRRSLRSVIAFRSMWFEQSWAMRHFDPWVHRYKKLTLSFCALKFIEEVHTL